MLLPILCATAILQGAAFEPPRLAVLISIDQCRADHLERLSPLFGAGGFRRILAEGAGHPRALIRHAVSETGPGHALLATGAYPRRSGIAGNFWFDREAGRLRYCVGRGEGRGASFLRAETLADALRKAYGRRARILSLSGKDRAAILLGGQDPDLVLWFEKGAFRTSAWYETRGDRKYREGLLAALARLQGGEGGTELLRRYRGTVWSPLHPPGTREFRWLSAQYGPDDRPCERPPGGFKRTFPHVLPDGPRIVSLLPVSPFGNDLLAFLAAWFLEREEAGLGRDGIPDLLCLSFSSLDYVGHAFGPRSLEAADVVLRLDRALEALFGVLDAKVGRGRWVCALSADHGVRDAPGSGPDAPRTFDPWVLDPERPERNGLWVRLALRLAAGRGERLPRDVRPLTKSGPGPFRRVRASWFRVVGRSLVLRKPVLESLGLDAGVLAREAAAFLRSQPEIAAVFDPRNPQGGTRSGLERALALSYAPGRSGDLLFAFAGGRIPARSLPGLAAFHGSAALEDRLVPLWFLGKGIRSGSRTGDPPGVEDLVPTLARVLGIPRPKTCEGRVLAELLDFRKGDDRR